MTVIGANLYVKPGRREEFIRLMRWHQVVTNFESQVFRKDGRIIWISENVRAARDRNGNFLYYEGTVTDITERKEAELRVKDSETLYHSLVETIPQNIFRKDLMEPRLPTSVFAPLWAGRWIRSWGRRTSISSPPSSRRSTRPMTAG